MKTERKMLIAAILVAIMVLNCVMPILTVGAATDVKVTFESNLYSALKDELLRQEIKVGYIDAQRTIVINDEEIAKVTSLSLSNSELTDLTGLEVFTSLTSLDLSSNELNKDSNLEVLNSFNLSSLDLSSNEIEDVSMITNIDNIANVSLHNQKFNIVEIVEVDTSNTSDQLTEVSYALPQILSKADYLNTDWLIEERTGLAKINWSKFDHQNVKIQVAEKSGSSYVPYKSMVTLRIKVSDSKSTLYNSDINMFFVVVDSNERGIHIVDENMYEAIKDQLTAGQTENSNLITYSSSAKRNLYERSYNEPQVLVIKIDDIINKISSFKLSNKKIELLDGIEKFVGLEKELDLSGNYIKSIDKLIELQENQIHEEQLLRERVSKQLALISETLGKISGINTSLEAELKVKEELEKKYYEIKDKCEKLEAELATLKSEKENLEEVIIPTLNAEKNALNSQLNTLNTQLNTLKNALETLNSDLVIMNKDLVELKSERDAFATELQSYKDQLSNLDASLEAEKVKIQKLIDEKQRLIDVKNTEISQKQTDINNKQAEIDSKQLEIDEKEAEINNKQAEIDSKTTTIAIYDTQISDINMAIAEKETEYAAAMAEIKATSFASMVTTEEEIITFGDNIASTCLQIILEGVKNATTARDVANYVQKETEKFLKSVYGPINEQMALISGLVTSVNATSEDIENAIEELNEIIVASLEYLENNEMVPSEWIDAKIGSSYIAVSAEVLEEIESFKDNTIGEDLDTKSKATSSLETKAIELNSQFNNAIKESIVSLLEEKDRLQTEIDNLNLEINNEETGTGLQTEKAELEEDKSELLDQRANLETEKATLETEKTNLESARTKLEEELVALKEQQEDLDNTFTVDGKKYQTLKAEIESNISAKEKEIANKNEEITAKEKQIIEQEAKITAKTEEIKAKEAEITAIQAEITKKETEITEKQKALEEKEKEVTAKIAEITNVVKELNTQEASIAQSEIKIAEFQKSLSMLEEILVSQMARLYTIYNRVDKLTSFATSELKLMTPSEYENLTFEQAKSMFGSQIQRIAAIENSLTSFETKYLISKYEIPTETVVEVNKTVQNADGTTSVETVQEVKEIENPIGTYFNDLVATTEQWSLSEYKSYLSNFRTIDVYFSMAAYCYLFRSFDEEATANCVASEYANIEIENLEFDGEDALYIISARNNFSAIASRYGYVCKGTPSTSMLVAYASRMVSSTGDIATYVCLPRLKSLDISENLIENMDNISQLADLRILNAYNNELVNISTINWANMTKLRTLDLGFNSISDISSLENLVGVEYLYLASNLIGGSFEFNISKIESLKYLDVSENQINDIEKLVQYLTFEARANGYQDIASFLRSGLLTIKLNNQNITMKVENKFEVNENRRVDLPKIFRQIEEIDSANTSFGIDSLNGNVTNDGKEVILDTTREGNFNTVVSITSTRSTASLGAGTNCRIQYTVGNIIPVNVTITPEKADVIIGETKQFTAEVTGDNVSYRGVIWEIEGAVSAETNISSDGLLTIGADETADTIIVKATSVYDAEKSAQAEVTVVKKQVTKVTLTPETATIMKGESLEFTANVEGNNLEEADKGIKWGVLVDKVLDENGQEVAPSLAAGTSASKKDNKLVLSIGAEEKINKFTIVATSTFDNEKVATATVTVDERTVSEVKVTPETASVEKGKTQTFTTIVNGENLRDQDKFVTYTVTGNNSRNTKISEEGVLTVGADETANTITVVVTSNLDNTKKAEVIVTVTSAKTNSNLGYIVDEEYVLGVATKTPVNVFKTKLAKDYTVIVKENGTEVTSGYMKTGMFVEVQDKNGDIVIDEDGNLLVYEVVVKGDVNSDGVADALDSNLIKAIRNEVATVTDVQMKAADIDNSGEVDIADSKLLLYHRAEVRDYCLDYAE